MKFPGFHSLSLIALAVALCSAVPNMEVLGAVFYVDGNLTGNTPGDGTSWETAYATIGEALGVSQEGDEIWVAAGNYRELFQLKNEVALYGGFSGTELNRNQRDWGRHITTVSGAIQNVRKSLNPVEGDTSNTRLDGFTITGPGLQGLQGLVVTGGAPRIVNNTFIRLDRRAIRLDHSSAVVSNNWIVGNGDYLQPQQGGGIGFERGKVRINHNWIIGNKASSGAGIAGHAESVEIDHNLILGNYAERAGAGIEISSPDGFIHHNRIINNHLYFSGDSSTGWGAGISAVAFPFSGAEQMIIYNNLIMGNTASDREQGSGGGIYSNRAVQIFNNTFLKNAAAKGDHFFAGSANAMELANNLFDAGSIGIEEEVPFYFHHNCLPNEGSAEFIGFPSPVGAQGNIAADAMLIQAEQYGLFALHPDSPCRDAGDNEVIQAGWLDQDGQLRIHGETVDMGADETDGLTQTVTPQVVRVSPDGNDSHDGSSWEETMQTVQAALDRLQTRGGEVWVEAGTYSGNIQVYPFTYLYGGFQGNESSKKERNPDQFKTVLNGNQAGSVVDISYTDRFSGLDGFTIENGRARTGGGIICRDASPFITHNVIRHNSARWGGGIGSMEPAEPLIANNRIVSNQAISENEMRGGAIYLFSSHADIVNNVIRDNAAISTNANESPNGGGIYAGYSAVLIANNTLLANITTNTVSPDFQGLGGQIFSPSVAPQIINNIVALGSSGIHAPTSSFGDIAVRNNCVFDNRDYDYGGIPDPTGTKGNLSADPLLVNADNDFHLTENSPCIDTGDSSIVPSHWSDLDGQARIAGSAVDIGADEWTPTVPSVQLALLPPEADQQPWVLQLTGDAPQTYVFEAATNLVDWVPIATNDLSGDSLEIANPAASQFQKRYYRVKSLDE